jgi:hypothetical protein
MATSFEQIVQGEEPKSIRKLDSGKSGALVASYNGGLQAVIKPVKEKLPNGKETQRGLSVSTQPYREVAFYRLAKLYGFQDIVPETVLTEKAIKGVVASAQEFLPAFHLRDLQPKLKDKDRADWSAKLRETALMVSKRYWRQLVVLDLVAGARDRHANNAGVLMNVTRTKPEYRLKAWDNACTFGKTFEKYHNVFHKYLFRNTLNLDALWPAIDKLTHRDFVATLGELISSDEVDHAWMRHQFIGEFPYRLPWKIMSEGNDTADGFPPYLSYFEPVVEPDVALVVA